MISRVYELDYAGQGSTISSSSISSTVTTIVTSQEVRTEILLLLNRTYYYKHEGAKIVAGREVMK